MRVIICDRCGKKTDAEDVRKSITISQNRGDSMKVIHCDRLKLTSRGEIHTDYEIDLCDQCKVSFVKWYGKVGIYER